MYLWGQRSPSNLGNLGFRPNQAVQRSIYGVQRAMQGLADDVSVSVDPTMLIAGVGVLALAGLLFAGKRAGRALGEYKSAVVSTHRKRRRRKQLAASGFF
jgi:hypothetical protein